MCVERLPKESQQIVELRVDNMNMLKMEIFNFSLLKNGEVLLSDVVGITTRERNSRRFHIAKIVR